VTLQDLFPVIQVRFPDSIRQLLNVVFFKKLFKIRQRLGPSFMEPLFRAVSIGFTARIFGFEKAFFDSFFLSIVLHKTVWAAGLFARENNYY